LNRFTIRRTILSISGRMEIFGFMAFLESTSACLGLESMLAF